MNFNLWKENTEMLRQKGEQTDNPGFYLAITERCHALRDFLDDNFENILTEEEQETVNHYLGEGIMKSMVLLFKEIGGKDND